MAKSGSASSLEHLSPEVGEPTRLQRNLAEKFRLIVEASSRLMLGRTTAEVEGVLLALYADLVPADAFALWRVKEDGRWRIACSDGLSETFVTETLSNGAAVLPEEAVVVQPSDIASAENPLLATRWERYRQEGIASLLIQPLRIHGSIDATFAFYCKRPYEFDETDVAVSRALANITAAAITTVELRAKQEELYRRTEQAAKREAFVAMVGFILSTSIGYEETLANIARASVPDFADWCVVDLLDERDELQRLAVAHVDPAKEALAREVSDRYPSKKGEGAGVWNVITTGQPEMAEQIPESLLKSVAHDEEHLRILRELHVHSYICVPLCADGVPRGTISFICGEAPRRFSAQDMTLAMEIARRGEQSLENARLYTRLRNNRARLRAVIEVAVDGIIVIDKRGVIESFNPAAVRIFGYEPHEVVGQNVKMLMPEPYHSQHDRYISNYLRTGDKKIIGIGREVVGKRRDGSTFPMELAVSEAQQDEQRIFVGIVRDVSERKEAEREVEELNKALTREVRARTRLSEQLKRLAQQLTSAEIAERRRIAYALHDHFQQILVAAKFGLHSAKQESSNSDVVTTLEGVEARLSQAIEESRSLAVEVYPPVLYDSGLAVALEHLASRFHQRYELEVALEIDPAGEPRGHEGKAFLYQATHELLLNVVKHAEVKRASVRMTLDGALSSVTVCDRGMGFDPATLESTASDSSGFGLFSLRHRTALFGGTFSVTSAPGEGTSVTVSVPSGDSDVFDHVDPDFEESSSACAPTDEAKDSPGTIRVLVVDDHVLVRQAIATIVGEPVDIEVVGEAADGVEAIEQAHALQPDVLLMDYSMPRMNGIEATRHIRAALPNSHVIAVTMYVDEAIAEGFRDAGAAQFVDKTSAPEVLLEAIRNVVTSAKRSD